MSLTPGTEFAGYTIVRRIGAGGMGEVYLAQHPRLPRQDVIKVLSEHFTDDAMFRARFVREAELAARLDHPCIVNVYDRGESDGRLWIAMQYVPGIDGAALLTESPDGLPALQVATITDAIGAALDHAHRHGLLHRDVKPANILISDPNSGEDRIRLADFGIARQADGGTALTSAHMVIGSFPYSSPEQLSGETLDARTDVYSLACTVYELLAGTTPFPDRSPAVLIHHHLSVTPPPVSQHRDDLPPEVSAVIAQGLAKHPDDRPETAGAFATSLHSAIHPATAGPLVTAPGSTHPGTTRFGTTTPVSGTSGPTPTEQPQTLRVRARAIRTSTSPASPAPAPAGVGDPPSSATSFPLPITGHPARNTTYPRTRNTSPPSHPRPVSTARRPTEVGPVRASGDYPAPTGVHESSTAATRALACGVAAVPLSLVGGIGLPIGAAGLRFAARARHGFGPTPHAVGLATVLCVIAIVTGIAVISGAIAWSLIVGV
ncbi:protein kinase [Gordonia sp. ABSL1-1]|uniref:serine/threonine-protein kinase n=1 Tax=Gordonia sp. ABSL1-1 TaxID=3053923 RepID=UPI002573C647|nr:serine/threonine-protein kinase [Gordonia sp. ABSL1-1]MDL9938605.1 protein kinase [Gordonia sp. ABSL1-1]